MSSCEKVSGGLSRNSCNTFFGVLNCPGGGTQLCVVGQEKDFCSSALTRYGRPSKANLNETSTQMNFVMHKNLRNTQK